jgi:site-specific DNA-methyltransferase (adenine-specific)
MSSDVEDVVLDPFSGTGTTAIAAKTLQRNYIGIEIDESYASISEEKLQKVRPTMFEGIPVSVFLGKICTVRDVDAKQLFKAQLTSTEKKRLRASNGRKQQTELIVEQQLPF